MMTTRKIIQINNGENVGTYDSVCFAENFKGNIDERVHRFYNWDCNIPVETNLYREIEVDVPSWMTEADYMRFRIQLKYSKALVGDVVYEFTQDEFSRFTKLSEKYQYWYGWALKSKNKFIANLVEQFNVWIKGGGDFGSPLSYRQFEVGSKYCPLWEVNSISSSVYRTSKY